MDKITILPDSGQAVSNRLTAIVKRKWIIRYWKKMRNKIYRTVFPYLFLELFCKFEHEWGL